MNTTYPSAVPTGTVHVSGTNLYRCDFRINDHFHTTILAEEEPRIDGNEQRLAELEAWRRANAVAYADWLLYLATGAHVQDAD